MKLRLGTQEQLTKKAEYFDLELIVPFNTTHLATDSDGTVYAYEIAPYKSRNPSCAYWSNTDFDRNVTKIGMVNFDKGETWDQSLVAL